MLGNRFAPMRGLVMAPHDEGGAPGRASRTPTSDGSAAASALGGVQSGAPVDAAGSAGRKETPQDTGPEMVNNGSAAERANDVARPSQGAASSQESSRNA